MELAPLAFSGDKHPGDELPKPGFMALPWLAIVSD